ncbi:MAG: type I phosphomannose isomerase catalytic subunit [Planctomycetota bacterium]|nr:type I phosphomannose isomerase catalytic subunit [Planctomycetota bacterium]
MDIMPLATQPILLEKVWGGSRLAAFNRDVPEGLAVGESWDVSDYENLYSYVSAPPLGNVTLHNLLARHGEQVLGQAEYDPRGRFPLLFKLIDASQRLSLQVHPDDEVAAKLNDPNGGKEEAWFVLESGENGRLALGLRDGTGVEDLLDAISSGREEEVVNWVPVRTGDFVLVRPGLVHAIDSGVVLAEIQQTSDATYRLSDWGSKRSRATHHEQARAAIRPELSASLIHTDEAQEDDVRLCFTGKLTVRLVTVNGERELFRTRSADSVLSGRQL